VECHIKIGGVDAGVLWIEVYTSVVPKLGTRFVEGSVAQGDTPPLYQGAKCIRFVEDGWLQFSPSTTDTVPLVPGTLTLDVDENFILKHDHRGTVSLVNKGPNSNGTSFLITLKPMSHFDLKYVVIGTIIYGEETLQKMERVSCSFEKPDHDITMESRVIEWK
jgi:cyclophilin family peptidyl-prolyl cis-trans isomerase